MPYRRGQNAVEYLMTYGWAILVVLIAGVVMWQMGFLDLGRNVQPGRRGFSQITPLDWSLNQSNHFTVVIQNNAGTILRVNDGNTAAALISGNAPGQSWCTLDGSSLPIETFRPGATATIVFSDCPVGPATVIGSYYRVNLTIDYVNPASGLPHLSNGLLWGPRG
jgi:hypothetical protein